MMEENDEILLLEDIEKPGEISDEPIFGKSFREIRLGSRHTKVRIDHSYCKKCGRPLKKDEAVRCSDCSKLICRDCCIIYTNAIHCKECLRDVHQIFLTKEDFMVLFCVSNGLASATTIFKLSGIPLETVKSKISSMIESYLTQKPASFLERFFPKLRLTNLGNDALQVFDLVYQKEADLQIFKQRVQELKAQRKTFTILKKGG